MLTSFQPQIIQTIFSRNALLENHQVPRYSFPTPHQLFTAAQCHPVMVFPAFKALRCSCCWAEGVTGFQPAAPVLAGEHKPQKSFGEKVRDIPSKPWFIILNLTIHWFLQVSISIHVYQTEEPLLTVSSCTVTHKHIWKHFFPSFLFVNFIISTSELVIS